MLTYPLTMKMPKSVVCDDDELLQLCEANSDLQIERDAHGNLILMSPTGSWTGRLNALIVTKLSIWNERTKLGEVFESSSGFVLPNGAMRAPDASWIPAATWARFSLAQRKKFLPVCPDFVVELHSSSDRLRDVKTKMEEWIDNGCRLGWIIDPEEEKAYIYRPDADAEQVDSFDAVLSGEEVLPGFTLDLSGLRDG